MMIKSLKKIAKQVESAREKVVEHIFNTYKRGLVYFALTTAFWLSIQDSGILFWVPLILMIGTAFASALKLTWGTLVFIILWKVDGKVDEINSYASVAISASDLALSKISSPEATSETE